MNHKFSDFILSFPENNILKFKLLEHDFNHYLHSLESDYFKDHNLKVYILRLDEIHPEISGNKWFKLKYNLLEAIQKRHQTVLTFGGAYSNHIAATAAAGKLFGLKTIGVIRGDEKVQNHTLEKAQTDGMQLIYVSRTDYKNKNEFSFIEKLKKQFGDFYLIPEGGSNLLGAKGCTEMIENIKLNFDFVCCACGTGTTLGGIALGLKTNQQAIGFSALKGGEFLVDEVQKITQQNNTPIKIISDYHFGGYAKTTAELLSFIEKFETTFQIPLDKIYTGKMIFGIFDLIKKNYFPKNKTLLVIHSGGLQGNYGFAAD